MCDYHELEPHSKVRRIAGGAAPPIVQGDLASIAWMLANQPEMRSQQVGFSSFGDTQPGDRVLLAVDTHYDMDVVDAVTEALRRRGATVDRIVLDAGPDRDFVEADLPVLGERALRRLDDLDDGEAARPVTVRGASGRDTLQEMSCLHRQRLVHEHRG